MVAYFQRNKPSQRIAALRSNATIDVVYSVAGGFAVTGGRSRNVVNVVYRVSLTLMLRLGCCHREQLAQIVEEQHNAGNVTSA